MINFSGLFHVINLFFLDSLCLLFFRQHVKSIRREKQRVLVIRLDAIGDFILWLDAAFALRNIYPQEEYELVLLGNSLWSPVAEDLGLFDDVWPIDRKSFIWKASYRMNVIKRVREFGFDTVLHPVYSREFCYGDALVRISGAGERVGLFGDTTNTSALAKKISDRWYTELFNESENECMELERNADFIHGLGCESYRPSITRPPFDYLLPDGFSLDRYCVFMPGAGANIRQWPVEFFYELGVKTRNQYGIEIVICGAPSEANISKRLLGMANAEDMHFHDWTGKTSLKELIAIIAGSEFVVCNESSAAHIAAVTGVQSVCVLGGGHYGRFLPYPFNENEMGNRPVAVSKRMDCYGCNWHCIYELDDDGVAPCVEKVSVDDVWSALKGKININ